MMSGHGANLIFFNKKKKKIGRPEHLLTFHLHPPPCSTSNNISFTSKVVNYLCKTSSPNFWLGRETTHDNRYYLYFKNFKRVPLTVGTFAFLFEDSWEFKIDLHVWMFAQIFTIKIKREQTKKQKNIWI